MWGSAVVPLARGPDEGRGAFRPPVAQPGRVMLGGAFGA